MNLDATLDQLARDPHSPVDLAEVALYLARDEYPPLDPEAYLAELVGLARDARPFLGRSLESQVAGLCRFLFHEVGFQGNATDYYDPRNSYLNEVLDRQLGIPITLSLVTMAVGRHLELAIDGIPLPGHFVVMARDRDQRIVFDPFGSGRPLTSQECEELVLQSAGIETAVSLEALEPATPGAVVVRLLTNLKGCYLRQNDFRRAARTIRRLRQVVPGDWSQARDLGACYLQGGKPGKAIDEFQEYLRELPQAPDREAVAKLLRRACGEVAKWN